MHSVVVPKHRFNNILKRYIVEYPRVAYHLPFIQPTSSPSALRNKSSVPGKIHYLAAQ